MSISRHPRFPLKAPVATLILAISAGAASDLTRTVRLTPGSYLDLETGSAAIRNSGGDVFDLQLVNGTLAPLGQAKIANLGVVTSTEFNEWDEAKVRDLAAAASAKPVPGSALVASDALAVITNSGHASKMMITVAGGGLLQINFTTFLSPAAGTPVIKAIFNNSSHIAPGRPNYGIAPSSLFVITGTSLADPGNPVLQSSGAPGLPLTLNGASIAVVVNSVTTHPALYYTSPGQLAAVLPASTPVGTGTLTVTYNGLASAPAPIQVVPSAVGINTYGWNTGVATDATTGSLITFANSAAPGKAITLWTTGLGADSADSDTTFASNPHSVNTPLEVYVGGVPAKILYQGSAGYPGVDQINIVIPDGVPAGCWVSLAALTGRSVLSNVVTLPIHPGGGPCVDPETGLNGAQLFPTGGKASFKTGLASLILSNTADRNGARQLEYTADAAFVKYTGVSYDPANSVSPGSCVLLTAGPIPSITGLDAGAISLTGPAGLSVKLEPQFAFKGTFFSSLPAGAIPSTGGTFTFTGTGGADIGSFTSVLTLSNPLLTWTNPEAAATIDRASGLLVTWTGGNPGSFVMISGSSVVRGNGTTPTAVNYECKAPAEAGRFTVPSYILLALPNGQGGTNVQNLLFAPMAAKGLDIGAAGASIGYSVTSNYGQPVSR